MVHDQPSSGIFKLRRPSRGSPEIASAPAAKASRAAERHDEDITVGDSRRVERLDGGDSMIDARVVDQGRVEGCSQGELADAAPRGVVDRRRTADDVLAGDQQDEDVVDPVAMDAFGRREPRDAGQGLDPELMCLHAPGAGRGREATEERAAEREDGPQALARADLLGYGGEPARDAAVERVVLAILIMRLVGFAADRALGGDGVDGVAATPVAA